MTISPLFGQLRSWQPASPEPGPQVHCEEQLSPLMRLPSSHSSPVSTTPSPHCGLRQFSRHASGVVLRVGSAVRNLGLAVIVGHWLGHERHGFDCDDPAAVSAQLMKI